MAKYFNMREGFSRKDDYLLEVFTTPLKGEGPASGKKVVQADFERMLDSYYKLRGWDLKTGNPTESKLKELGLIHIVNFN